MDENDECVVWHTDKLVIFSIYLWVITHLVETNYGNNRTAAR